MAETLHETLEWNPLLRQYEHIVQIDRTAQAKYNHDRKKEIGNGMCFRSEAKEIGEIDLAYMHDPLVREFLTNSTGDRKLMKKVFAKYPSMRTSTDGPSTNKIFIPSEVKQNVKSNP